MKDELTMTIHTEVLEGLRPCVVGGKKAAFHQWAERAYPVGSDLMIGGSPGGQIRYPVAIVEYGDGSVEMVDVEQVRFLDTEPLAEIPPQRTEPTHE